MTTLAACPLRAGSRPASAGDLTKYWMRDALHYCVRARWTRLAMTLLALTLAKVTSAQTVCVFDPLGAQGDYYSLYQDYQLVVRRYGVTLDLVPYVDEERALTQFKAGKCEALSMTGLRARQFNKFTGTIDSPGSIDNYADLHDLLNLLPDPKLDPFMRSGDYEVLGVFPIGAGYSFVKDRRIIALNKAVGKRVAVIEWDKTEPYLVKQIGAIPVPANINDFVQKFNDNSADIVIAPIILYKPYEMSNGLGLDGGIIRRPVLQLTMQLIARADRFPPGFGRLSRSTMTGLLDRAFGIIRNAEHQVESHYWIYDTAANHDTYMRVMRDGRVELAAEDYFDRRMLGSVDVSLIVAPETVLAQRKE